MIATESQADCEFAILGAGAIGSILGAHLARAGHSVIMLARGQRATQIQSNGLRLTGLAEIAVPVSSLSDPSRLKSAAVLIVATKTFGTAEALATLRHVTVGSCFSIQNGTLKDELLAEVFGIEQVLGALADTSGELLGTGEVVFTRNVNILIGELSGGISERATQLTTAVDASGVRAAAVADIRSLEWTKFVGWVGLVVLSVTTRALTWKYLLDPGSATVLVRMVREMGRLTRALGIELTDRSTVPVASICEGTEASGLELLADVGRQFQRTAPQHRMSSLQDLDAGRPLEIHETLGYALEKGRSLGIDLPLLSSFYPLLAAIDRVRSAR
jgi:2-dehydropantoate 2-reductase